MWLLYNRFTVSRKIDDPSNQDLVDEIGNICFQWATTRDCFSKGPKFSKWKPGMQRTWPNSKSLPRLTVKDDATDAPLDWIDLPDYFCEFRDLRITLHQRGEIQDLDDEFIHHIHIKRVDEVVEFSILQHMPTDEDQREDPDIKGIYPPKLFNEIINNYDCDIKDYRIKNSYQISNDSNEIYKNIFDRKRRIPLIMIPEYFLDEKLENEDFLSFFRKVSSFAELWIYEGKDFYEKFQNHIQNDGIFAIIYSPRLEKNDLSDSRLVKKILPFPYNYDFLSTSNDIVNELMKRTRTMELRSELSKKVDNALEEKARKIEEEINQEKINHIINKNNTVEEKNIDLVSRIFTLNNELMAKNTKIAKTLRDNEKLSIQKEGFHKKYNEYKMKYNQIKSFQEGLEAKARERNLSVKEIKEIINNALKGEDETIIEEIEYLTIFDLVRDLKTRNPDIIFSNRALSSSKNADNTGRYSSDNITIKKIKQVYDKLNEHFYGSEMRDIRNVDFHNEMSNLFPGKYSDESRITLDNIKKYSGNNRRIFEVFLPDVGEVGIEMTWHIKVTNTIRINICCINFDQDPTPIWSKHDGRWIRNHKMESVNYFGDNIEDYPKILIGYCGVHLKTAKIK